MKKYVGYYVELLQDNNDDLSDHLALAINASTGAQEIRTLKPFKQNREEDYKKFNELANYIVVEAEKGREFSSFEEASKFGQIISVFMSKTMEHMGHTKVTVNNKISERNGKFFCGLTSSHEKKRSLKGRPHSGARNEQAKGESQG